MSNGKGPHPEEEEEVTLEGTLAMIKPDAVAKERDIVDIIRDEGFLIVERRRVRFSQEGAEEFYIEHADKPFYQGEERGRQLDERNERLHDRWHCQGTMEFNRKRYMNRNSN